MDRASRENNVLTAPPVTGGPTDTQYKTGDTVYYKAHHLSNAHKKFHAGFAPKWWGPVKLHKRVGKGVFITDQQPPRKIHVSCLKRADTTTPPLPPPNPTKP